MPPTLPAACTYVLRLAEGDPERLVGRIEHVASGRRYEFDDGVTLLAYLVYEQRRHAKDQAQGDKVVA